MPEVHRTVFLRASPEDIMKHLELVLLKYRVRIKEFSKYFIRGEHGSYSATLPSNCKKEIHLGLMELRNGTRLDLTIDYTKAMAVELIGAIIVLIIGLWLYGATTEALDYLELYKQRSWRILFEEPPYLFKLLMQIANDIDIGIEDIKLVEYTLLFLYIMAIGLIISFFAGLGYIAYMPYSVNKFVDNIVVEIQQVTRSIGSTSSFMEMKESGISKEGEESVKTKEISVVNCAKTSSIHILCTVGGTGIDKDSLIKALMILGFNIYEVSEGVYSGEKPGSYLASDFLDRKMKVRILFDQDKVNIIFETSQWTPFSDKDCRKAEEILFKLLR